MAAELEVEKRKTDELLCELMPATVADSLRQGRVVEAGEFYYSRASVLSFENSIHFK